MRDINERYDRSYNISFFVGSGLDTAKYATLLYSIAQVVGNEATTEKISSLIIPGIIYGAASFISRICDNVTNCDANKEILSKLEKSVKE